MKKNDFTAEQKVRLVMGEDMWSNYDCDGQLYRFIVSDGPVGLCTPKDRSMTGDQRKTTAPAVAFPSMQMLSHCWDGETARLMGHAIANDAIDLGVDVVLGPGINIKRDPRNGRNFEYISEDPYLAGTLGREYVIGVQECNVGACVKHFCCNNTEFSRNYASMEVDERTLREIYLRPFEIAAEAQPWTLMSSYNRVNGIKMASHAKLYNVLRNDFGFNGLIMSDWSAVEDPEASLNAELDLEMPYDPVHSELMLSKANELDKAKLDRAANAVIALSEKCKKTSALRKTDMTVEERREVAKKVAERGIVLLKNDGVLPIKGGSAAVTGAPAVKYYYGGGSSAVIPETAFTPLDKALGALGIDAAYVESVPGTRGNISSVKDMYNAMSVCAVKDVAIVCVGNPNACEDEGWNRSTIKLSQEEELLIRSVARVNKKTVVCVFAGSAVDMSGWIDSVSAVVWAGYGGQHGTEALAEVLTGAVNPSGKLTETFPLDLADVPAANTYSDDTVVVYSEGLNVGYRYFDSFDVPVLFPFGYGLSYSSFEYGKLKVDVKGGRAKVSFTVTNTSDVDGEEIAQVYVRQLVKRVYRPEKELKGYKRVFVPAHKSVKVEIELDERAFSYYSTALDCWTSDGGLFEVQVGGNIRDIALTQKVTL